MAVGLGLMLLRQKLHASIRRSTHSSLLHVDDAKDAGSSNGSMIVQRLAVPYRLQFVFIVANVFDSGGTVVEAWWLFLHVIDILCRFSPPSAARVASLGVFSTY